MNIELHISQHQPEAIRNRLAEDPRRSYLKEVVLGGVDGAVTTFAIVAGVVGAGLSNQVILILGFANVLADGLSMAAGVYLGVKSEAEALAKKLHEEEEHIRIFPEGEKEEVREIYRAKGFSGQNLEDIVEIITSDRSTWIQTMLQEEHGYSLQLDSAWKAGLYTFLAFIICGCVPLLIFLLDLLTTISFKHPFALASFLTAFTFFMVGTFKSFFSLKSWYRSGTETLLVGSSAAAISYLIGWLLGGIGG